MKWWDQNAMILVFEFWVLSQLYQLTEETKEEYSRKKQEIMQRPHGERYGIPESIGKNRIGMNIISLQQKKKKKDNTW